MVQAVLHGLYILGVAGAMFLGLGLAVLGFVVLVNVLAAVAYARDKREQRRRYLKERDKK